MRLKDKVAVIVGGANGIGRAIAIRFAQEGASVAINDIDTAAGQALESEIERLGGRSFYLHGDATSEGDVSALMTAVMDRFGGLDILVNNVVAGEAALAANDWDTFKRGLPEELLDFDEGCISFDAACGRERREYLVSQRADGVRQRSSL